MFNIGYKVLFKFDVIQGVQFGTCNVSSVQSPASHWGGSVLIPGQIECDFLWTKWHLDSLFPSTSIFLMDAIPLCDIIKTYTDIYVNTQQLLLDTTLFYTWRHVSAAHAAIFRPAYNRTGPFMCAQYGIPHCLHIKYMWNKYMYKTYNYMWWKR